MMCRRKLTLQRFCGIALFLSFFWGCGDDEPERQVVFVDDVADFMQVSRSDLDFGRQVDIYTVMLTNENFDNVRWTASTSAPWITVNPNRGVLQPWAKARLNIRVRRGQMSYPKDDGVVTIDIPAYEEQKVIQVKALD